MCTVGDTLEPVAIGRLERFVGDMAIKEGWANIPYIEPSGYKVGIVGAGPAGMACAADMAKAGCDVTVYEAFHQPGGVLKYGIPDFRLPNEVIDAEIDKLKQLGIKFECNTLVGRLFTIEQMVTEMGFHAVFIGTGAGYPSFMGIPGESLNGVLSANELLTRCNLMRARDYPNFDTPLKPGKHVAVIGAGNTAMDALRVSLRLGAESVHCVYRRSKKEAPARVEEIHHAEEEGVDFNWLSSPVEILGDDNKTVRALRCVRMELGEPDESGRRRPVSVPGSEFELETDMVVFAIGTNANPILGQTSKLKLNKRGYIATDENLATSIAGVYAGGDIVTGAATVIEAMGAGRKAARGMKAYLGLRDTEAVYDAESDRHALRHSRATSTASPACASPDLRLAALTSPQGHPMTDAALLDRPAKPARAAPSARGSLTEHIVEVISDSGEGAQRCGQSLAAIAARSGNGIWTVEIIPAEIQPPARSVAGASGIRIRIGAKRVTNGGDETDLVVAFNEQVLLGRVRAGELKPGATILLESTWREHKDPTIVASYVETVKSLVEGGFRVIEIPLERECRALMTDARRGKNMFVLGMLCSIYSLDLQLARDQVARIFGKKDAKVIATNVQLLEAGFAWGEANLDFKYAIPAERSKEPQIVVNGNTAIALGVLASGMDICAMYPITPATSASHYLSDVFERVGGMVHQAEDEIAACAFAIGASYAGRCAVTITSGPGYSLKQEGLGLAVMAEIPLVVVNVQRGGPSTGQPTKVGAGRPADRRLRQPRRRAEGGDGGERHRGLLLFDDHGAQDRRDLQHGRRRAVGREPRHRAAAVPAAAVQRGLAGAAARPVAGARGRQALRLGSGHRHRAPLHSGPAGRHAHADRPRARPDEQGRLRPGDQRGRPARAQPQARGAAEDAQDPAGVRRSGRRPAGRRLGQHQGRDRGGRRPRARRGAQGLVAAPALHPADAVGHPRDPAALRQGDDGRGQLVRPARGRTDRRGQPPLLGAGDDAALALPGRHRLLERGARPADQARQRREGDAREARDEGK